MHKISTKLFLILLIGGGALVLSLFFRGQTNFLSSSFVGDVYYPEETEEPYPTEEPPVTPDCRETHSISGPASVSFTEASGPATYLVTLNRPSDSQAIISSITVEAIPKNTPAINYKHPADGSGAGIPWMTWSTQSLNPDGLSAIIKSIDYAWYGVSGDDDPSDIFQHPHLGMLSNQQSVYDINVTAILDNGCQLAHTFEMQVPFSKTLHATTIPTAAITEKKEITTTLEPFQSIFGGKKLYKSCISASDVFIKINTKIQNSTLGQYRTIANNEESYHVKQLKGELGWSQGGFAGINEVLRDIFVGTKYCSLTTSPEIARENAKIKFSNAYLKVFSYFTDIDKVIEYVINMGGDASQLTEDMRKIIQTRCWMEKKAKEFAGSTPNKYGGLILEHTYPGCAQDAQQPEGLVNLLRSKIDFFRGYVQDIQ